MRLATLKFIPDRGHDQLSQYRRADPAVDRSQSRRPGCARNRHPLGAAADPIVLAVVRLVSDPPRGVDGHEHMPFVRYREYSRWPVHAV